MVVRITWFIAVNFLGNLFALCDDLVSFDISPLVHPDHGEGETDQEASQDEFAEGASLSF